VNVLPALLGTQPPHFAWPLPLTVDRSPTQTAPTTETTPASAMPGFLWGSAVCVRDCSQVINSNGVIVGTDACECVAGFTWNSASALCVAVAINCGQIANSNGTNNGDNACFCLPGFLWGSAVCVRDCSQVINSNGVIVGTDACECVAGFTWNSASALCVAVAINCGQIANSNGTNNGDNACFCFLASYGDQQYVSETAPKLSTQMES
jgi:hypothetical protein